MRVFVFFACLIFANVGALASQGSQKYITIVHPQKSITVELAETYDERALGLMFRDSLCAECGMLFTFEAPRQVAFWMRNTYIPLDIAYIDASGKIVMIAPLEPLSEQSVKSPPGIKYALEMNRGWFETNQWSVGDSLAIRK